MVLHLLLKRLASRTVCKQVKASNEHRIKNTHFEAQSRGVEVTPPSALPQDQVYKPLQDNAGAFQCALARSMKAGKRQLIAFRDFTYL